ncbi:hypothetical protein FRB90_003296, partial [Tulasnella sp. 427]
MEKDRKLSRLLRVSGLSESCSDPSKLQFVTPEHPLTPRTWRETIAPSASQCLLEYLMPHTPRLVSLS